MSSEVVGEAVDVPRPVAIILQLSYIFLLALGMMATILTFLFMLGQYIDRRLSMSSSSLFARASSDTDICRDEDSGEECTGLEFGDDTDEEYLRRPY